MIAPERRKALIEHSLRLRDTLERFHTPNSGKTVAPSHLGEVFRFVQDRPSQEDLKIFLKMLPGSHYAKVSKGAGPQLQEVVRQIQKLVDQVPNLEELLFVIGWTRRLLGNEQQPDTRSTSSFPTTRYGKPPGRYGRGPR